MSIELRVVVVAAALLVASPLNGGQRNLAAAPDMRELSISQVVGGTRIAVPVEVSLSVNGDLNFRIGPFFPRNPLLLEHLVSETPATILRASSQQVSGPDAETTDRVEDRIRDHRAARTARLHPM